LVSIDPDETEEAGESLNDSPFMEDVEFVSRLTSSRGLVFVVAIMVVFFLLLTKIDERWFVMLIVVEVFDL